MQLVDFAGFKGYFKVDNMLYWTGQYSKMRDRETNFSAARESETLLNMQRNRPKRSSKQKSSNSSPLGGKSIDLSGIQAKIQPRSI